VVLQPAIVRPDHLGRTHPDPRADPPTLVLDPSGAQTTELHKVGPDTDPIPVIPAEPDTARLPIVEVGSGAEAEPVAESVAQSVAVEGGAEVAGPPAGHALALSSLLAALAGLVSWLVTARLVPVAAVGDAQLVVSTILLAGGLAQLAVIAVLARRSARAEVGSVLTTTPSQIGATLLFYLVPIVVNVRFGPETGAVFFAAWLVFIVVDVAAVFFMSSLSVSVAREPHRAAELVAATRRRLLVLFLPALALGVVLAGPLLGLFGATYAEAGDVLRLLLLGLAFRLVVTHELGVRQALGHGGGFARLQLLSTVLVLVMAILVPVTASGVAALRPVAIGYIVVQVACAAAVLLIPAARRTDVEVRSP
jgi:O-antigen/teichoic acid export membrane protein